jgi:hypothetical protein
MRRRKNRGEEMANFGDSNKRRESIASSGGVLMADRDVGSVRLWWHVWRWPAIVFAGVLLWLVLVTIAGATTAAGGRTDCATVPSAVGRGVVMNTGSLPPLSMPWASRWNVLAAAQGHCLLRTGFTPRRP